MNTLFEKTAGNMKCKAITDYLTWHYRKIQQNISACGENDTDGFSKRNIG